MTEVLDLSSTSPAEASTAAGASASGLAKYLAIRVDAVLIGATGGTLDVYIQRKIAPNVWVDWAHFPQLAAGASAVAYSLIVQAANVGTPATGTPSATIAAITTRGNDATPSPGLAAATLDLSHPGDMIRVVYTAGASTSAGGAQKIYVTGIGPSR
ncbi:MAG TPA: hypothetical protein VGK73_15070 [Polyangiaceae bacterium]